MPTLVSPETAILFPWFADSNAAGSFTISSNQDYYGYHSTAALNDYRAWTRSLKAGTYRVNNLGVTGVASGIVSLTNGGASLATVDKYSGSTAYNVKSASTGIALAAGEIKQQTTSKNASSSNYNNHTTLTRLVRTGA